MKQTYKSALIAVLSFCCGIVGMMFFIPDKPIMRDYQIETFNDSIIVYDGERKVGTANWSEQKYSPIEDVLLMDNL